jgi:hypothetical protein
LRSGHAYDLSKLESAAAVLGVLIEGTFEYDGDLEQAIWDDLGEPPTDVDGLPTTSEDQDCAFCGRIPHWVHPLDQSLSTFRHNGERHQLPTFWTICEDCEAMYIAGDDTGLAQINQRHERESLAMAVAGVRAFRAAEIGRKELAPSRYPD